MSEEDVFRAKISATDDASTTIEKIKTHLHSLGEEAEHVGHKTEHIHRSHMWTEFGEHISLTREHFGELRTSIGEVGGSLIEVLPMLGAFAVGAGIAELFETTEKVAENFGELTHKAEGIGTTVERLHDLHTAASMADTNVEALDRGLSHLNIVLSKVATGGGGDAAHMLKHLRIDPKQFHDSTDALIRFADVMAKTKDAKMRANFAGAMFGDRIGHEIEPLLSHGSEWMADKIKEAHEQNFNPDEDQAKHLERYNEAMKKLKAATTGFSDELGTDLAPVLIKIIEPMDRWVITNRKWIAQDMSAKVEVLGTRLGSLPWKEIEADAHVAIRTAGEFADALGGPVRAIEILSGVMLLKGVIFLAEPIIQLYKFTKGIAEATYWVGTTLVEAWTKVGTAADMARAKEEGAVAVSSGHAGHSPSGAAGIAEGAATSTAVRTAADRYGVAAGERGVDAIRSSAAATAALNAASAARLVLRAAGPAVNAVLMAFDMANANIPLDQETLRRVPGLRGKLTAAQIAALPHEQASAWNEPIRSYVPVPFPRYFGENAQEVAGAPAPPGASSGKPRPGSVEFWGQPDRLPAAPQPDRSRDYPVQAELTGGVRVDINLNGAPYGTTTEATVTGNGHLEPRINTGRAWADDDFRFK